MEWEFFDDPHTFLDAVGGLLSAQPVVGSVIASVTADVERQLAQGFDSWLDVDAPFTRWWAVLRCNGDVTSAIMRTAPFEPWMTYGMGMPDEAAVALAVILHERGEFLGGTNGVLPSAAILAEETARLWGGTVHVDERTRLWECLEAYVPPAPAGRLRPAVERDADLVFDWYGRFHAEADEQAGREPAPADHPSLTMAEAIIRIAEGRQWLWELPDGQIAHLTGVHAPAFGVARVGPVFTPKEFRGQGVASHVVGEVTRRGLEEGTRMCLFTDQDNPTSNKIYADVGYEPLSEMAQHRVVGVTGG